MIGGVSTHEELYARVTALDSLRMTELEFTLMFSRERLASDVPKEFLLQQPLCLPCVCVCIIYMYMIYKYIDIQIYR